MSAPLKPLVARLLARGHRGMSLGLDRTRAACRALGDPQDAIEPFHVAGTNGKGSVAAMLERILRESGRRTGLYTSPHLSRFAERIQIAGRPIDDAAFSEALERVLTDAPDELTFFETLTLAAFVAFRDARLDAVVLEVGLGGRLDSTNVVARPIATCVTSITEGLDGRYLEHGALLGATSGQIAREKAGIFKTFVPAVLGPLGGEAFDACLEVARAAGAPLFAFRPRSDARSVEIANFDGTLLELSATVDGASSVSIGREASYRLSPALPGPHQLENASVAAAMAHVVRERFGLDASTIERGIALTSWPGRLERLERDGVVIWLDGAHNVEGARALADALDSMRLAPETTTLVFGALADKAYDPVLRILSPKAARRIYASPEGRAPAPLDDLVAIADGEAVGSPIAAIERAVATSRVGDAVVVAGSLYLVGAIRAHLLGIEPDPVVGL